MKQSESAAREQWMEELCGWLRAEADKRTQDARSRRGGADATRGMSKAELTAAKRSAEMMFGRKLDLVSTSVKDNETYCAIQDKIAVKLEAEAARLNLWADSIRHCPLPAAPFAAKGETE